MRRPLLRGVLAALFFACALGFTAAYRPVSAAVAAADLPSKISDAEFWTLVADLSEPGGSFPFDNFVSNETTIQSVIPALKARTSRGGVYLGVGPEQNFTYIAALEPRMAFIIDIRRQNLVEHLMYKALFQLADNRADFISRLFSRKRPADLSSEATDEALLLAYERAVPDQQLFESNLREILNTLTRSRGAELTAADITSLTFVYTTFFREGPRLNYQIGGGPSVDMPTYTDLMTQSDGNGQHHSFLSSERHYHIVRTLEMNNLVIPVVGDFAGPTALREVGAYLTSRNATVTAFYLSNVERYLFDRRRAWRSFYANVAALPYDERSVFIRAVLNRPAFTLVSLVAPIADLMNAFSQGRIRQYQDVFGVLP
ncbi:MAG TPA: hypothetical protein VM818_05640 [Vicinamibacterales bacterium]|nr:hypothetical protein [Vicinamibacterales bacterium]